jgi:recombinational DNA repair ATPase RecF
MEIRFTGSYRSITEFTWKDIPPLAILTGVNGSGKSQLLERIESRFKDEKDTELVVDGCDARSNEVIRHTDADSAVMRSAAIRRWPIHLSLR